MKKFLIPIVSAAMVFSGMQTAFAGWEADADNTESIYSSDLSSLDGWEISYSTETEPVDKFYAKISDNTTGGLTAPYLEICDSKNGEFIKANKPLDIRGGDGLARIKFKYSVNHGNYNALVKLMQGDKAAISIASSWVGNSAPIEVDGETYTPLSGNTWRVYVSDPLGTGSSPPYFLAPTSGTGDDKTWCNFEIVINLSDNAVETTLQDGRRIGLGGRIYAVTMAKGKDVYMMKGKLKEGRTDIDSFSVTSNQWPNGGSMIRIDDLSAEKIPIVNIDNRFANEASVNDGSGAVTEPTQINDNMQIESRLYNKSISDKEAAVIAVMSSDGYKVNAVASPIINVPHYRDDSEKTGVPIELELKTKADEIFGDMSLSVYTVNNFADLKAMCAPYTVSKPQEIANYTADTTEPTIDADTNTLVFCQTTDSDAQITYAVLKDGTELSADTKPEDFVKGLYQLGYIKADANGKYAFKVKFAGEDARYKLAVNDGARVRTYDLVFENKSAKEAAKNLGAATSAAEIKPLINSFLDTVRLRDRLYNDNAEKIKASDLYCNILYDMIKDNSPKTTEDVIKAARSAIYLFALSFETDRTEFDRILGENIQMLDLSEMYAKDLYDDKYLTDAGVKSKILDRAANRMFNKTETITDYSAVLDIFGDCTLLSICENTVGTGAAEKIIKELKEKFEDSDSAVLAMYNTYASLDASRQGAAAAEFMKKSYDTIDELKTAAGAAVTNANKPAEKEEETASGKRHSGGGGGGGSFTAPIVQQSEDLIPPAYNIPEKSETDGFADLDNSYWAAEYITRLAERGIVSGDENRRFNPESPVLREEFVKMLVKTLGVETVYVGSSFDDVPYDAWYYEYVSAAAANKIVNGVDDSSFGAGLKITREDMCTMLYRALSGYGVYFANSDSEKFSDDISISDYAKDGVYALRKIGAVSGFPDGNFAPKQIATRAEVAKILSNVIDYADVNRADEKQEVK